MQDRGPRAGGIGRCAVKWRGMDVWVYVYGCMGGYGRVEKRSLGGIKVRTGEDEMRRKKVVVL